MCAINACTVICFHDAVPLLDTEKDHHHSVASMKAEMTLVWNILFLSLTLNSEACVAGIILSYLAYVQDY